MVVSTIKDVLSMAPDMPVPAFKATIKAVYPARKSKPDAAKKYHFQDILLTDATGKELKATLCDRDELAKEWKGQPIHIVCKKSDTHGWTGVKSKDDDYNDKKTRILWITKSAEIVPSADFQDEDAGDAGDGDQAPPTEPEEAPAPVKPPGAKAPPAKKTATPPTPPPTKAPPKAPPTQPPGEENPNDPTARVNYCRRLAGARANLMVLAMDAALYAVRSHSAKHTKTGEDGSPIYDGIQFDDGMTKELATTIFISMDRTDAPSVMPADNIAKYSEAK